MPEPGALTGDTPRPAIGLDPAQFAAAFPFHFAIDRDGRILQAGASLRRLCADAAPGATLVSVFAATRPAGVHTGSMNPLRPLRGSMPAGGSACAEL